jgi:asparagine synthase (glutamine-hydrolysing)
MQDELLTNNAKEKIGVRRDPYLIMSSLFRAAGSASLLDRMLYSDTKTYLHELLMKQDQMSMAASIESRVPFLDHKLMEFSARMPDRLKLRGRVTKFVLREAMRGILPGVILDRGKMGFPVPIGKWFRGEFRGLIDEYVLSERTAVRGIFAPDYVKDIAERHMRGENHDERLWSLLNFEMWQRRFIDGEV